MKKRIPILKEIEKIKELPDSFFIPDKAMENLRKKLGNNNDTDEKIKKIVEQKREYEISQLKDKLNG